MEVEFLLIGKGLTGQIKRCDYLASNILHLCFEIFRPK